MPILQNGELILFGYCGWAWDDDGFTATQVMNALASLDPQQPLTVRINSAGGYADEGLAIYHALRRHQGEITTVNEAMAASVGSLIFMAGDKRIALLASQTMIHDPMFEAWMSNADDLRKGADQLDAQADEFAEIYAERSGNSVEDVRAMMKEETWLTAKQAMDQGYATATEESSGEPVMVAMFPYEIYQAPPPQIVATARQQGWTPQTARQGGFLMAGRKPAAVPPTTAKETAMSNETGIPNEEALATARAEAGKAAQARMQSIMKADEAQGRTQMAEHLAYNTELPAEEAIALMAVAPVEIESQPIDEPDDDAADFDKRRTLALGQALPGGDKPKPGSTARVLNRADIFKNRRSAMAKGA